MIALTVGVGSALTGHSRRLADRTLPGRDMAVA